MESAKRLAEAMAEAAAKAMSSALAGVSAEFQNVFNSQLGQMSFTIEGLAANVEKIANQRRAAG
jgi:phage-related protein